VRCKKVFNKVLIANRGEIAVRIIRTCKRLGIKTVAVYGEADMGSAYVRQADESAFIGPAQARKSFLRSDKILSAARRFGCDAIHPGYGFLSENAEFAAEVTGAGLVFIGPPVDAIKQLGSKTASKELAIKIGVPVVPGHQEPLRDIETARSVAGKVGFPILLKPAAGGGGRGMRIVFSEEELPAALTACMEETRKSFADDKIFVERYVTRPRHIEFQIMGDKYGNVIHLGERECSIQRRYQKVIEEAPSTAMTKELRERMGEAACKIAKAAGYTNAGTVEFILDEDKNFYFLEVNTRLQVEHPITEMVTNLDLVELQLRVAAGQHLPIKQEDVAIKGWAIEARICAEDPYRGFLPTTGMVTRYALTKVKEVRVDTGIEAGSLITIHYDSLLAKVCAWGEDRREAIRRLVRALNGYHIEGITTNVDFANAVINHPAFGAGDLSTDFIEDHFQDGVSKEEPSLALKHQMVMAAVLVFHSRRVLVRASLKPMSALVGSARMQGEVRHYVVRVNKTVFQVNLDGDYESRQWKIDVDGRQYSVVTPEFEYYRRRLQLEIDGQPHMFRLQYQENHIRVFFCGTVRTFEIYTPVEWSLAHFMLRDRKVTVENVLKCPMPGLITEICVNVGAQVRKGQEVLRMESMKMESGVASPCDGEVESILVRPSQAVETDDILLTFKL
jgi:propionyl-CoA carboxylase alpha chain